MPIRKKKLALFLLFLVVRFYIIKKNQERFDYPASIWFFHSNYWLAVHFVRNMLHSCLEWKLNEKSTILQLNIWHIWNEHDIYNIKTISVSTTNECSPFFLYFFFALLQWFVEQFDFDVTIITIVFVLICIVVLPLVRMCALSASVLCVSHGKIHVQPCASKRLKMSKVYLRFAKPKLILT